MKKLLIREELEEVYFSDMTLDFLEEKIQDLRKRFGYYENLRIEGVGESYPSYYVVGDRLETDKEYNKRIKILEKEKIETEKREAKHKDYIIAEAKKLKLI